MDILVLDTVCVLALTCFLYVLACLTTERRGARPKPAAQVPRGSGVRRITASVRNKLSSGKVLMMPTGKRNGHQYHPGKYVA